MVWYFVENRWAKGRHFDLLRLRSVTIAQCKRGEGAMGQDERMKELRMKELRMKELRMKELRMKELRN